MPDYALLVRPDANRVYRAVAGELARAELGVIDRELLGGRLGVVGAEDIAGVPYLTFTTAAELDEAATTVVSNLSVAHALFERRGELLAPVALHPFDRYDDDLLSTQRYTGKTNETFTKLLVNLALAAAGRSDGTGRLIDPLCGRGTTVNQGLTYGCDVAGIEIDKRDVAAYVHFLTTWLQEKRIKHRATTEGRRHRIEIKGGPTVEVVADDTMKAVDHFGRGRFDLLVTDLPYGIQHRSGSSAGTTRSPEGLLEEALPVWNALLRRGAGLALAWNVRVVTRERVLGLLEANGFAPLSAAADVNFEHRVDRTITRDVAVARKP